jgi:hypothetical protein
MKKSLTRRSWTSNIRSMKAYMEIVTDTGRSFCGNVEDVSPEEISAGRDEMTKIVGAWNPSKGGHMYIDHSDGGWTVVLMSRVQGVTLHIMPDEDAQNQGKMT